MRNLCNTNFYLKTNVLQDFHICISALLNRLFIRSPYTETKFSNIYFLFRKFCFNTLFSFSLEQKHNGFVVSRNLFCFHYSFFEINLRNEKKWLLSCCYNPKKTSLSNHIAELSKSLDLFTTKYEPLRFLGDFNAGMEDSSIKIFCSS